MKGLFLQEEEGDWPEGEGGEDWPEEGEGY